MNPARLFATNDHFMHVKLVICSKYAVLDSPGKLRRMTQKAFITWFTRQIIVKKSFEKISDLKSWQCGQT